MIKVGDRYRLCRQDRPNSLPDGAIAHIENVKDGSITWIWEFSGVRPAGIQRRNAVNRTAIEECIKNGVWTLVKDPIEVMIEVVNEG